MVKKLILNDDDCLEEVEDNLLEDIEDSKCDYIEICKERIFLGQKYVVLTKFGIKAVEFMEKLGVMEEFKSKMGMFEYLGLKTIEKLRNSEVIQNFEKLMKQIFGDL